MTRPWQRRGGPASLAVVLLVAGAVLAGCSLAPPDEPALPPPPAPPGGPPSVAAPCGPRAPDAEQPPEAWVRFDVTARQLEVIDRRLKEVLCRQGLWRKGVGFGVNSTQEGTGYFVMIHPGRSGLTARQILDRFLGRVP
jgi:hypothetical protein